MIRLLDSFCPWFGDILDLGGNILLLIIFAAALIWCFIIERYFYLLMFYPDHRRRVTTIWAQTQSNHQSTWLQPYWQTLLKARLTHNLERNLSLIKVLIALCPLLGLLGTVLGMLEVFDAVAITGTNNPRTTASGVSKATVSTMAGMVIAISGLLFLTLVSRRVNAEKDKLNDLLTSTGSRRSEEH